MRFAHALCQHGDPYQTTCRDSGGKLGPYDCADPACHGPGYPVSDKKDTKYSDVSKLPLAIRQLELEYGLCSSLAQAFG